MSGPSTARCLCTSQNNMPQQEHTQNLRRSPPPKLPERPGTLRPLGHVASKGLWKGEQKVGDCWGPEVIRETMPWGAHLPAPLLRDSRGSSWSCLAGGRLTPP